MRESQRGNGRASRTRKKMLKRNKKLTGEKNISPEQKKEEGVGELKKKKSGKLFVFPKISGGFPRRSSNFHRCSGNFEWSRVQYSRGFLLYIVYYTT